MNKVNSEWLKNLSGQWGWIAFRGVLAILFAVIAIVSPIATAWALALFWGFFAFMEGAAAIYSGWQLHKRGNTWWPYLLFGIVGILAGFAAVVWPGVTMIVLVYLIGLWAIFGGMSEIFMAVGLRNDLDRWWVMLLSGIVSVLFGMLVLYAPFEGMLAMIWCLAGFALIIGIFSLFFAFRLKSGKIDLSKFEE